MPKSKKGWEEEYGKTYEDTHSQMARSETWRILLTLVIQNNWKVRQWDVVAAYLNAPLTHKAYVQDGAEYWLLHKALYGLKQAGHEWYKMLKDVMQQTGLQQCIGDPGAFTNPTTKVTICTHVDDMARFANSDKDLDNIETAIEEHVELEKLGIPIKILGMELTWQEEPRSVKLTQTTVIGNLANSHIGLIIPLHHNQKPSLSSATH